MDSCLFHLYVMAFIVLEDNRLKPHNLSFIFKNNDLVTTIAGKKKRITCKSSQSDICRVLVINEPLFPFLYQIHCLGRQLISHISNQSTNHCINEGIIDPFEVVFGLFWYLSVKFLDFLVPQCFSQSTTSIQSRVDPTPIHHPNYIRSHEELISFNYITNFLMSVIRYNMCLVKVLLPYKNGMNIVEHPQMIIYVVIFTKGSDNHDDQVHWCIFKISS